jgi:hypothetical protein
VKANGAGGPIALPLDQDPTVTVELRTNEGMCWSAQYSTAIANSTTQFLAKSDP